MRKYKKLFRYLFSKYANTCYSKKIQEFDALKEKAEVITIAEVTKMLKDHKVESQMLSREELATLLRLINVRSQRNDLSSLAYEGFQELFMQMAFAIFSRPPMVLSHLPLVESVQALVEHFAAAAEERGETTVLYKDPDTTALGDKDLLRELNKMVKENPDCPVPEGYRKVVDKKVRFDYLIKPSLIKCIPEATRICAELIEEVLGSAVAGTHILESVVKYETHTKVYPDIVKPQKQLLPTRYMDAVEKKTKTRDAEPKGDSAVVPMKPRIEESLRKLPTNMKLAVAQLPKELRDIGKEAASVLDEIIEAVEEGHSELVKKKGSRIVNRALKDKTELDEESKKADREKELKRKERHKQLKSQIADKKKKEAEGAEAHKKEEDESKAREKERLEKEREDKKKERDEVKKKLQEMRGKKEEEKKKAQDEEQQRKKVDDEKKAKAREEFLKKKKEELVFGIKGERSRRNCCGRRRRSGGRRRRKRRRRRRRSRPRRQRSRRNSTSSSRSTARLGRSARSRSSSSKEYLTWLTRNS